MGQALGYFPSGPIATLDAPTPDASVAHAAGTQASIVPTVMFLHGTSREQKSWPASDWAVLGKALTAQGFHVLLPQGSASEAHNAMQIAKAIGPSARVLPESSIGALAALMRQSAVVIGVDSGLMHLAVVLGVPTVAIMAASHLERFSAARFAPTWAGHAQVVTRPDSETPISVNQVFGACKAVGVL
jgi:heptosyltransferase-1